MGTTTPQAMHPILFENGTCYLLKVFPNEHDARQFVIGSVSFFKMLGFDHVPEYTEALVEEIAYSLKENTSWLRVRNAAVEYTPRVKRRTVRLNIFDMCTQRNYEVLLGDKARPFDRAQQAGLQA